MLSPAILTAGAVLALLQQSGQNVTALYPEDRETWVLEYPAVIAPYVEDYYSCLKGGSYAIGRGREFEVQYREDIPRCAGEAARFEQAAIRRLADSASGAETTPGDVAQIFETVRGLHVARGRSLDQTIGTNLRQSETYRASRGQAAAIAPESSACVAAIRTLIGRRDAFVAAGSAEIEARYAKDEFSDDDRAAFANWTNEVSRFAAMIAFERSRCPASDYVDLTADAGPTAASPLAPTDG